MENKVEYVVNNWDVIAGDMLADGVPIDDVINLVASSFYLAKGILKNVLLNKGML
jgi:hypothetical protein